MWTPFPNTERSVASASGITTATRLSLSMLCRVPNNKVVDPMPASMPIPSSSRSLFHGFLESGRRKVGATEMEEG
jgi:hypothetical protein